jgi:hypothetical protein
VERVAFDTSKAEFYREEVVQGEPIKGNFSNVARSRATGALLGPTNYHGYQPALRRLYEERFSRRMSFQEFLSEDIQILSAEQAIADWKEQARSGTTWTTIKETEPITFSSLIEAEQHFRKTYLEKLVKSGQTLECSGPASRAQIDRHVSAAVRETWERESMFPQQLVNYLRPFLVEAGLHFFKHRKRVLYVSSARPVRHAEGQVFSEGISAILQQLTVVPRLKRPDLAKRILGDQADAPEAVARKAQLASDLHYLVQAGHVIEFSDGSLELPLDPNAKPPAQAPPQKQQQPKQSGASSSGSVAASTGSMAETVTSSGEPVAPDSPAAEPSGESSGASEPLAEAAEMPLETTIPENEHTASEGLPASSENDAPDPSLQPSSADEVADPEPAAEVEVPIEQSAPTVSAMAAPGDEGHPLPPSGA